MDGNKKTNKRISIIMSYLTSILLIVGIMCLSYGINKDNMISTLIGAICLGIYNGVYHHKVWDK